MPPSAQAPYLINSNSSTRPPLASGFARAQARYHGRPAVSTSRDSSAQQSAEADEDFRSNLRRRSLEATYYGQRSGDGDLLQEGQSVSESADSLERSYSLPESEAERKASRSAAASASQTATKQRRRRHQAPSVASIPLAPDVAAAPNLQLLRSRISNRGAASFAARRAARQEQGRNGHGTRKSSNASSSSSRIGPAEAFLNSLEDRIKAARTSAKRAFASDAASWYLNSMGSTTVLTRQEEVQLGAIMHLGKTIRAAQEKLRKQQDGKEASMEDVARLLGLRSVVTVQQRLRNAASAKKLLQQYNVKLVISVARQHKDKGVEFSDLLPAGMAGLERAIDRFDASKGFKFSTYAHWWIRQNVCRCVQEHSRVVRLPVNVYELLGKINKVANRLNAEPGRRSKATYDEIAEQLGVPTAKVLQVVRASWDPKSLDQPLITNGGNGKDSESTPLIDSILTSNPEPSSEDNSETRALKAKVDHALQGLSLRPRNILRYRYGMHQLIDSPLTLKEVGELYGLKSERIRQIESLAKEVLKTGLQRNFETAPDNKADAAQW